ncbi:MAG: extracellular solute-binding protein [Clostridia bacterium]|jgi:multiple sugar transport system substrate-binding protein|nr:extracellular solute-binding protein [Clostridiales bacterium]
MSKKLKPFALFLCIGTALFLLFGWKLVQNRVVLDFSKPDTDRAEWEGVISVWDYPRPLLGEGSNFGWIRDRIREFEKAHPGVFIDLYTLDWGEGRRQLDLAVDHGMCPDIAPVGDNLGYVDREALEPLDRFITPEEINTYQNYALGAVTHKGSLWGVPLYCVAPAMILNLDCFAEAGVAPPEDGKWTYREFVEALRQLTVDGDGDDSPKQYGFGAYLQNGYYNLWGIVFSDGWGIYDPVNGNYRVDTPEAVSGLEKLARLVLEYGVAGEDLATVSQALAWKAFAVDKRVAVYPEGAWAVRELNKLRSEGRGFEFGIAEYPAGALGYAVTVGEVAAYGVFRQQNEQKLSMCVKFIRYLAESLRQQDMTGTGLLPVRGDDSGGRNGLEEDERVIVIPKLDNWYKVEDVINRAISRVLLGEMEPSQAFSEAQREIDGLHAGD